MSDKDKIKDEDVKEAVEAKSDIAVGVADTQLTNLSRQELMNELYRRGRTPEDIINQTNLTGPEIEALATLGEGKAKGGVAQQMELFSEGGLKDEGGTVDPVSGNDVPPGSTQEEVRDDIPAQLSEGEFVFPADVVRFLGLNFLMELRQKAKAGLKRMEEMGQMGNSDEATLPDDIPFTMEDLDIAEDAQDNVIEANIGTFVPPRFRQSNVYNPTATPYSPTGVVPTIYAPATAKPTGETQGLLGASAQGAPETENRRYVNKETNQVRFIPFIKGTNQSLYPIPKGFAPEEETVKQQEPKQTKVQTAKVKPVDTGDGGDDAGNTTSATDPAGDPLSYQSLFNMDALDKNLANLGKMQLGGFNIYSNIASGVTGKANINALSTGAITSAYTTAKNNLNLKGTNIGTINNSSIRGMLNNAIETAKVAVRDVSVDDEGNALSKDQVEKNINALAKAYGVDVLDKSKLGRNFNLDVQLGKKLAEVIEARQKNIEDRESKGIETGTTPETSLGIEGLSMAQQQGIQDAIESNQGSLDTSGIDVSDIGSGVGASGDLGGAGDDPGGTAGSGGGGFSDQDAYGGLDYKQGGLAGKKKTPKSKKMKRGGLASR